MSGPAKPPPALPARDRERVAVPIAPNDKAFAPLDYLYRHGRYLRLVEKLAKGTPSKLDARYGLGRRVLQKELHRWLRRLPQALAEGLDAAAQEHLGDRR